jgi:hypothetical protein
VGEHPQQGVDVDVALKRQVERSVNSHAVDVPPSLPFAVDVPGLDQIGNDALRGAFGDVEKDGDVSYANASIPGYQQERVAVIREEPKVGNGLPCVNNGLFRLHGLHYSDDVAFKWVYQKRPNNTA